MYNLMLLGIVVKKSIYKKKTKKQNNDNHITNNFVWALDLFSFFFGWESRVIEIIDNVELQKKLTLLKH